MRLLIVEDESELAGLVAQALGRAGFAVDALASAGEANAALATIHYDLVLLDLSLPDGDGLNLLATLRSKNDPTPVLIITARDEVEDRVAGLDSGADDYLLKPFHIPELVSRVKALLRRPNSALGMRLTVGDLVFDTIERRAFVADQALTLSNRELSLLEVMMRRPNRVVSKETIEESLYSFETEVGSNAIEVLVHRLRRKLYVAGTQLRIHTLRGIGYMLSGEDRC